MGGLTMLGYSTKLSATLLVALLPVVLGSQQGPYAAEMNWPLCGYNTDATTTSDYLHDSGATEFPIGWHPALGCPANRRGDTVAEAPMDAPVRSAFGPRPLKSANERYDFHRGIDLPAVMGTPAFAIADGVVRLAGTHSSYNEPVIIVRHYRPGFTSCRPGGCYHAMYLHMRTAGQGGCCEVSTGDPVTAGQLLGYTGASASGFEHLHFEIRDAPPSDKYSYWSKDAVNPLGILPYESNAVVDISWIVNLNDGNVTVMIESPRHDIMGVALTLRDVNGVEIVQPGNTPDQHGYNVNPSFFLYDEWNRQYTHKDSSSFPWEAYGQNGSLECPYYADHSANYDANVHMDQADPANFKAGKFNGVTVHLMEYAYYRAGHYYVSISFDQLNLAGLDHIDAEVPLGSGGSETSTYYV